MKLKRSKYVSLFFLISFFVSCSLNICLASNFNPSEQDGNQHKNHLHFTQNKGSIVINNLLFEENENEQEFDPIILLLPSFLRNFQNKTSLCGFSPSIGLITKPTRPIYIQVNNFRI